MGVVKRILWALGFGTRGYDDYPGVRSAAVAKKRLHQESVQHRHKSLEALRKRIVSSISEGCGDIEVEDIEVVLVEISDGLLEASVSMRSIIPMTFGSEQIETVLERKQPRVVAEGIPDPDIFIKRAEKARLQAERMVIAEETNTEKTRNERELGGALGFLS